MRLSIVVFVVNLYLLGIDALILKKKVNPAVVSIQLERSIGNSVSRYQKRQFVESVLDNEGFVYTVTLLLGTPPQSIHVQLDTGSSDLVVETASSTLCVFEPMVCSSHGVCKFLMFRILESRINFKLDIANSSSTYTYLDSNFQTTYTTNI